jgi:soluble lytic murein transglycosylase
MRVFTRYLAPLFVLLAIGGFLFWRSDRCQRTFCYPLLYEREIARYAAENALEPWLLAAVIKNESRFRAGAVSPTGATGLMQVMPQTGEWIAGEMKIPRFSPQLLKEPAFNIRLGAWYLRLLARHFGSENVALAAYNAGRGHVEAWLEDGEWDGKSADGIPFEETRKYVRRVLADKAAYRRLYREVWTKGEIGAAIK